MDDNCNKILDNIKHFFDNKSEEQIKAFYDDIIKENEYTRPLVTDEFFTPICADKNGDNILVKQEYDKLIFLDIDGVLNSETFYKNKSENELFKEEGYPLCEIDPSAIEKINKIIRQTKAKVVISSSWRLGRSIQNLQDIFNKKGFIDTIIGVTPLLKYTGSDNTVPRGCEIEEYLNTNFEYDIKNNIKYVIIDDDIDMLFYQKDHFLHTTEYDGITDVIVTKAINLLNN